MLPKQAMGASFKATGTNDTASAVTVTVTAVSGMKHYITDISASSDIANATLQVKDGTTVIWQYFLGAVATRQNAIDHTFATPIWGSSGAAVSIVVDGGAADKATANVAGFTAK